ncbi:MAG: putative tricarboxylic transport membrane protein [Gammaproteobacteria bacterium]|jgi:putative tricarboxylic transport membrane protein
MTTRSMHEDDVTDFIVAGATVAFAALMLFVLIPFGIDDPGIVDVLALGPSFWPTIICSLLLLMGVTIAVQTYRRVRLRRGPHDSSSEGFVASRWFSSLALLAGLYVGLHHLGMVLTCTISLFLFMLLGGERRPMFLVGISLALPLALFAFFRYVANVFIPLGVLEPWLGG